MSGFFSRLHRGFGVVVLAASSALGVGDLSFGSPARAAAEGIPVYLFERYYSEIGRAHV